MNSSFDEFRRAVADVQEWLRSVEIEPIPAGQAARGAEVARRLRAATADLQGARTPLPGRHEIHRGRLLGYAEVLANLVSGLASPRRAFVLVDIVEVEVIAGTLEDMLTRGPPSQQIFAGGTPSSS